MSKTISLINRGSQEALDSMSEIVWAINPQQDHLSDLVRKIRRVASEVLAARDITSLLNVVDDGVGFEPEGVCDGKGLSVCDVGLLRSAARPSFHPPEVSVQK